jgi:hypothetical protein
MSAPGLRFRIVSDDDGHKFIIPADKTKAWEHYVSDLDAEQPEWAVGIGGCVSLVTFTDPVIQ